MPHVPALFVLEGYGRALEGCMAHCAAHLVVVRAQTTVTGLLEDDAHLVASFQVCTSWVHVVDALIWPASTADAGAVPDPTPGGRYPADQQQPPQQSPYPTAAALWCASPSPDSATPPRSTLHKPAGCVHAGAPGACAAP